MPNISNLQSLTYGELDKLYEQTKEEYNAIRAEMWRRVEEAKENVKRMDPAEILAFTHGKEIASWCEKL